MALASGSKLGPYEVLSLLGAGGMGEVYRASDPRLGREVAIKVLPSELAEDPERLARFEREARLLAALNHPHIAHVYGFESATLPDGSAAHFLAMELVPGEELAERLKRGAIPVDEAIAIARQIAEGLEEAHERGIVHRDLKPANIKVTPEGKVKLLDFGLAKALEGDGGGATASSQLSQSPTMSRHATEAGMILGTAAYMSPEQAKGRAMDRRADIWSFGVVLYEMLSGRRLFEAETVSEVLAAVLRADIDLALLPAATPTHARRLIARCLDRDPKQRLRDIGEARIALEGGAEAGAAAAPATPSSATRWLWPALAAFGAAAALTLAALYLRQPAREPPELVTFEVAVPDLVPAVAISPDGGQVLYGTRPSETRPSQLWLRSLGSLEARPVQGTEGVGFQRFGPLLVGRPLWSPDGRGAVFLSSDSLSLRRTDTATGQTTDVFRGDQGSSLQPGAWSRDGVILYGRLATETRLSGIWRVAETGGAPVQVSQLRGGESFHVPSGFLPDGRRFLYFVMEGDADDAGGEVRLGSIDVAPASQDKTVLLTADGPAVYSPALDRFGAIAASGYLLFVSHGSLMAQSFDPGNARLTGAPVQVASDVSSRVSASTNGRLVYRPAGADSPLLSELTRFDRGGRALGTLGGPAVYGDVSALADGRRLALSRTDRARHVHIADIARGVFTRLSPGNAPDYAAAAAPDDTIAYTFSPEGVARDIYVRAANGVGDARRLVASATVKHPNDWSPDGRFLIYDDHVPGRAQDLLLVGKEGGASVPLLATDADEVFGQFSPDGKWIAYRSTESGRAEVYVRDFVPDPKPAFGTEKVQISVNGGDNPRWSPGGREIYFLQGSRLMAAPVRPGKAFHVGPALSLFETRTTGYIPYDVMADGTFIVNTRLEAHATPAKPFVVMLNWQVLMARATAEMGRR